MFNTTNFKSESKVVAVTQVVEKTITPDKVTEMYDSVREEVEKNIVQVIRVDGNFLKGVAVETVDDYRNHERKIRTRFILNGQEEMRSEIAKGNETFTQNNLLEKLKAHYVDVVSNYLLREVAPFIVSLK